MPMPILSSSQIHSFHKNGYLVIKNFCSEIEIKKLLSAALNGTLLSEMDDSPGTKKQVPWFNEADDGVLTNLTHSEKVVTSVSHLLSNESPICHIQAKFIEKQPNSKSSWEWHQDYAWWYMNGLLYPDQLMSFAVALTPSNKATGCSQVIKGSHKLGRVDHGFGDVKKSLGADMNMVNNALVNMELTHIEMAPGDAVFFHSNLLHRCEANLSGNSSWFIISTYATQENLATNDTLSAWHLPIEVLPNESVLEDHALYVVEDEISESYYKVIF